ncbi:hypothetical protein [Orrella marina]|uniref:Uncharacterized protein n=1 Tax=Orrella marina TaxID=2163011 RepID=A0A2R4XIQ2_9BURK|nr:hypothetical protein [Orrella marina]AWB33678.1 hypothetical protein DBV39_08165 [Orrella marina]
MSRPRSVAFDRALKIELLRTRAALERESISAHASQLRHSLDPREQMLNLLPGSASGVLGQVGQLAFQYPYLLSSAASLLTSQLRRPKRLLVAGGVALVVWAATRYRKSD